MNILNASLDSIDPEQWTSEVASMSISPKTPASIAPTAGTHTVPIPPAPINFSWFQPAPGPLEGSSEYKSSYRQWDLNVDKPRAHRTTGPIADSVNFINPSDWKSEYQASMSGKSVRSEKMDMKLAAPRPVAQISSTSSSSVRSSTYDESISCQVLPGTLVAEESTASESSIGEPAQSSSPPIFTVKEDTVTPTQPLSVAQFKRLSTPLSASTEYRDQYTAKTVQSGGSGGAASRFSDSNPLPKTEHQTQYQRPNSSYLQQNMALSDQTKASATAMTTDSLEVTSPPQSGDTCRSNKPDR